MNLSANFTLNELTKSETATRLDIDNTPNEEQIESLRLLCEKCGEVILYEHLTPKHFCRRQIKPVVLEDTGSSPQP